MDPAADFREIVARGKAKSEARLSRALGAFHEDQPVELHDERGRIALIHPGYTIGHPWRYARFDADGPVGHTEAKTRRAAVEMALEDGYLTPAPYSPFPRLDEVALTDRFLEGNDRVIAAQAEHARTMEAIERRIREEKGNEP